MCNGCKYEGNMEVDYVQMNTTNIWISEYKEDI